MYACLGFCISNGTIFEEFERTYHLSPKSHPLAEYTCMKSPWASSIEVEDFVENTYDVLSRLIKGDPELGKMLGLLALFSPVQVALENEQKCSLKQFQSKISMVIYNHILGKETVDNSSAFERITRLVNILKNLNKCGEIFHDGIIYLDVEDEMDDIENIEVSVL